MGLLDSIGGLVGGASSASPWGLAAGLAGSAINLFTGNSQKNQGKKLLKQIGEQPTEAMPTGVEQNVRMARTNANQGLPSEQYALAMQNLQRQQLGQLKNAADRRGGLAAIGSIGQGYNDSMLKLDSANAQARMQNQRTLYGVNNQQAQWQDRLYRNNILNPWQQKYQMANSLLGRGNQNFSAGLDQGAAALLGYGSQGGFGGEAKPYNNQSIGASNRPQAGLNYIPYDEQLPH